MYCHQCGKEINTDSKFCSYCGAQLYQDQVIHQEKDDKSIGYAILSFFIPIVGIIFYVLWKNDFPMRAKSCLKGFIAGIVVYVVLMCCLVSSVVSIVDRYDDYQNPVYFGEDFGDSFPF